MCLYFIKWLNFQAEPPTIVVATIGSLCQLIEKHIFKLESMRVLVIDEVMSIYIGICKILTVYIRQDSTRNE